MKWILVSCFGYLGYKNARFGKVAAHIAVCAPAREALLKTVRIAEERGSEIVRGIVDSLWLKKEDVSPRESGFFAGQTVRYLIIDAQNKGAGKRVKAAELIDDGTPFDGEKYVDMLILAATSILSLFGYTEERLKDEILYGDKQTVLKLTLKM